MRIPLIFLCSTLFFAPLSYADSWIGVGPPPPPPPPPPSLGDYPDSPPPPSSGSKMDVVVRFKSIKIAACGPAPRETTPRQMIACLDGKPKYDNGPTPERLAKCEIYGGKQINCVTYRTDTGQYTTGSYSYASFESLNSDECKNKTGQEFEYRWNMLTAGWDIKASDNGCIGVSRHTLFCSNVSGDCGGTLFYTGEDGDLPYPTNLYTPVPSVCEKDPIQTGYFCPIDQNKNGKPDDVGQPRDILAVCGYDSRNRFACSGGSFEDTQDPDPDDGDLDPDIEDPDPTDPDDGDSVNPDDPPDEPDVDDTNTGDLSGVISAIHNQNRDINTDFTNLIRANNKGFADINSRLNSIDANTYALNDNVSKQLLQDYKIYKEEKTQREKSLKTQKEIKELLQDKKEIAEDTLSKLEDAGYTLEDIKTVLDDIYSDQSDQSQNIENAIYSLRNDITDSSQDISNSVAQSLGEQTQELKGAIDSSASKIGESIGSLQGSIDGQTDSIVSAAGELKGAIDGQGTAIDGVKDKLDELIDKLEPCEPTKENNYCENPHGLTTSFAGDVIRQATEASTGSVEQYENTLTSELDKLAASNLTADSESHIQGSIDKLVNIFPKPGACTPLSFASPFGGSVTIDCKFSTQLKLILSFVIYIYTLNSLIDILLTEVVPVSGTQPRTMRPR